MSANQKQVSGTHYKTEYQHWDMLVKLGFKAEYFIGQFTKYISRWQKKNGIRDIRKGQHFLEKLIELTEAFGPEFLPFGGASDEDHETTVVTHVSLHLARYFKANEIDSDSRDLCTAVIFARTSDDLREVLAWCDKLATRVAEENGVGADLEKPVAIDFEFLGYPDGGAEWMLWKCKKCQKELKLGLAQPPVLHHTC